MSRLTLLFAVLIVLNACGPSNLLLYKYRRFYDEQQYFKRGSSSINLYQSVCHVPRAIDAGSCYDLVFFVLDSTAALSKRVLNPATDTAIIQYSYGIFSVWDWDADGSVVTGEISILHWGPKKIRIKENLVVIDNSRHDTKRFKGRRTFRLEKPEPE